MTQGAEVVQPTRYEILILISGAEVVWRRRHGYYPEQLHEGRWLSDFGLGDYECDRSASERRLVVEGWDALPEPHRTEAREANSREALKLRVQMRLADPPVRRSLRERARDLWRAWRARKPG